MRTIDNIKADLIRLHQNLKSGGDGVTFDICGLAQEAAECLEKSFLLPCKRGDVCYEVERGHGVIKHVVTGLTVYNRGADGKRYMTDIDNIITVETWAVADNGCEWPDHYSPDEWEKRIQTREDAEAALKAMDGII